MLNQMLPRTIAIATVAAGLIITGTAVGHSGASFFEMYFDRGRTVDVFFDRQTPTGAFRDRFVNAFPRWEGAAGIRFNVHADTAPRTAPYQGRDAEDHNCDRTDLDGRRRVSLVSYQFVDGSRHPDQDRVADTVTCKVGGRADFFYIYIDTANDYYFGRGDVPRTELDLSSVATHEIGHALGWGEVHYDEIPQRFDAANCERDSSEQETMCSMIHRGTERMRTLEGHDIHTAHRAYNEDYGG